MAGGTRKKDSNIDLSKYGPGKREADASPTPKPPAAKKAPKK